MRKIKEHVRNGFGQLLLAMSLKEGTISDLKKNCGISTNWPIHDAALRTNLIALGDKKSEYKWIGPDLNKMGDNAFFTLRDSFIEKCQQIMAEKRGEKPQKVELPIPEKVINLSKVEDSVLFAELKRRGYVGLLEKKVVQTFEI